MSEAKNILEAQTAALDAVTNLNKMLDRIFSEREILERNYVGVRNVLSDIRTELGVAHNFPRESLPGLIAVVRNCCPSMGQIADPATVPIAELSDWLDQRGFLRPENSSKAALRASLDRVADRALCAETDRYNLQQAVEREQKKNEDLASRFNRVGQAHNAAAVQLDAANARIAHLENTCAEALAECESLTRRIDELEKQNSTMHDTVRSCIDARCKAEAEARMSTEHAAKYYTQLHNIRCAMEAKGFPPNIDIASFICERLVCKES